MCRIAGFWSLGEKRYDDSVITQMGNLLAHGGPDDAGVYTDADNGIYLAFRRLSIIDLSAAGHQPMRWNGYTILFNGELYNYNEVRNELLAKGYEFNGHSDTEVLLKAFHEWGTNCINKFIGMFAFAIWNSSNKKLYLCRDRVGVKPLYFYEHAGFIAFSSELRSIIKHPDFKGTINHTSTAYYLRYGYIPSPSSIFNEVQKLQPGHWMIIDNTGVKEKICYWNAIDKFNTGTQKHITDEKEFLNECEALLTDACKLRMVADVPVGMFLSGGIDSSLVTALLQKTSATKLQTFTIGFEDKEFDESVHAKKVAEHLGTDHTEYICTENDFLDGVRLVPEHFDEPFGDSSCIPAFLVSQLARKSVKVALSADGGDEVFTGYVKYIYAKEKFNQLKKIPQSLRAFTGTALQNSLVRNSISVVNKAIGTPVKYIDSRINKFAEAITANSEVEFLSVSSAFGKKDVLSALGVQNDATYFKEAINIKQSGSHIYSAFTLCDINAYLEGDILTKVDRASMHTALEAREPLLDHRIIEMMLGVPDEYKIRNGQTKWVLRSILNKYLPEPLYNRPKQGFALPVNKWLREHFAEDLKEMANDNQFAECFRLNQATLKKIIQEYIFAGKDENHHLIWFLYMLHSWYKKWNT